MNDAISIKQFEEFQIPIYGTYEEPLFKAKDIGELLGIEQIRKTIQNLDEQWFVTEDGLYELLFISRKPIAKQFRLWIRNTLKEIRLTGKYESQKYLENESKSNTLIEHYMDKSIAYIGIVKEIKNNIETYTIVKYGITRCVEDTLIRHRNMYGNQFYFTYMIECENKDVLERKIQTHTDLISRHVKEFNGKKHKELLRLDNNFGIEKLIELIKVLKDSMENKREYSIIIKRINKTN